MKIIQNYGCGCVISLRTFFIFSIQSARGTCVYYGTLKMLHCSMWRIWTLVSMTMSLQWLKSRYFKLWLLAFYWKSDFLHCCCLMIYRSDFLHCCCLMIYRSDFLHCCCLMIYRSDFLHCCCLMIYRSDFSTLQLFNDIKNVQIVWCLSSPLTEVFSSPNLLLPPFIHVLEPLIFCLHKISWLARCCGLYFTLLDCIRWTIEYFQVLYYSISVY